jgi:hypothetical protein
MESSNISQHLRCMRELNFVFCRFRAHRRWISKTHLRIFIITLPAATVQTHCLPSAAARDTGAAEYRQRLQKITGEEKHAFAVELTGTGARCNPVKLGDV